MVIDPPVRWGVIGTGGITQKFLGGARLTSSARVVAVGSRSGARATSFAAEHGIERVHASYEAFLADPGIEAVYVSLPNALHHEWTMAALSAGKHVLCEKPYSPRPADVEAAFDAADRAGLILSEAFMWRHHPQAAKLVEVLSELEPLQTIRSTFSFVMRDDANVRLDPVLEGGSLLDVGTYCVNGARLLAGEEPDLAYGSAVIGPTGVDIRFTGMLRFPSGVLAEFTSGFTTDHRGLEAIGARGSVLATDPWHGSPAVLVRDGIAMQLPSADPYQLEIEDMCEAIRSGRPPLLGRRDALGQARALAALLRSAQVGRPIRP